MTLSAQVIVSTQIKETLLELELLRVSESIIEIVSPSLAQSLAGEEENEVLAPYIHRHVTEKETFSVGDAKLAIEKAYLASQEQTVIILAAKSFSVEVQNKLLKVLEEPPANKIFILIVSSKATLLSTIRSRLPVVMSTQEKCEIESGLSMSQLSLATVYTFVQTHKYTDAKTMKTVVEQIAKEAIFSNAFDLDKTTLKVFSDAIIALDYGSPSLFVLNTVLLKLLARKKR